MLKTRQKELQIDSVNSSEDAKPDHYKLPESMYKQYTDQWPIF